MIKSQQRTEVTIITRFSPARVANILYEYLPEKERLPGAPVISIEQDQDGGDIVLTQVHRRTDWL